MSQRGSPAYLIVAKHALVIEALNRVLGHRLVEPELLLIHTDQGSQYRASDYRILLEKHEIVCSMSAKGCCWNNAVVESSFLPSNLNLTSMTMPEPYSILLRSRGHWPSGSRATTAANTAIQRSVSSVQSITSNALRQPLQSIL